MDMPLECVQKATLAYCTNLFSLPPAPLPIMPLYNLATILSFMMKKDREWFSSLFDLDKGQKIW